jgi:uncharacterized damage-inducible protein DinB
MKNSETITVFQFNSRVLHINIDDLTHEDSLASPKGGGNSINWIVGHLLTSRDDIFEMIGIERRCSPDIVKTYSRGTENVTKDNALNISELVKMFDASQKPLEEKIAEMDYSAKPNELKNLTFLAFHEAYHCGQTGILRRVAGKEGAIK